MDVVEALVNNQDTVLPKVNIIAAIGDTQGDDNRGIPGVYITRGREDNS